MRVRVGQMFVAVLMRMAHARHDRLGMAVAMVLVVLVLVAVLRGIVRMKVGVPLGEMEPDSPGHESRSDGEVPG